MIDQKKLEGLQAQAWQTLQKHWLGFLVLGIISLILGSAAIMTPLVATGFVVLLVGAVLLINGISQLIHCFKANKTGSFIWGLITAVIFIIAGGLVLARPLLGAVTLTLIMSIFFILEGITKIATGFQLRPAPRWNWLFFSGLLSLFLGIIIFSGWPGDTIWIPGMFLGIDLVFGGWSLVMVSLAAKRGTAQTA
jgi:uncharacterized membrane protein HdeD (DUF308 family)